MTSPQPLGRLIGALSAHTDVESMTQVLTSTLAELLPPSTVEVAREQSLGDRLRGRPGRVSGVTVLAGDRALVLREAGRATEATIVHTVRGVVLSHKPVSITEWITALAAELEQRAARDDAARAVLDRLLLG